MHACRFALVVCGGLIAAIVLAQAAEASAQETGGSLGGWGGTERSGSQGGRSRAERPDHDRAADRAADRERDRERDREHDRERDRERRDRERDHERFPAAASQDDLPRDVYTPRSGPVPFAREEQHQLGLTPVSAEERTARNPATRLGPPHAWPAAGAFAGVLACVLGLSVVAQWWRARPPREEHPVGASDEPCGIRRLSLGFDWSVRRAIQADLQKLATSADLGNASARASALARLRARLRDDLAGARYGALRDETTSELAARGRFVATVDDLRARYRKEIVGDDARDAAPALRSRSDEGEGLVVVSVVVAMTGSLLPAPRELTVDSIGQALDSLDGRGRVLGLQVVWSPATDEDRLSSLELQARYPELIDLRRDGSVGATACEFCGAPFPAELGKCPSCGGAVPAA